ncbi:MAG: hypothetical protein QM784_36565 [Polyangiaceae bacterium]
MARTRFGMVLEKAIAGITAAKRRRRAFLTRKKCATFGPRGQGKGSGGAGQPGRAFSATERAKLLYAGG